MSHSSWMNRRANPKDLRHEVQKLISDRWRHVDVASTDAISRYKRTFWHIVGIMPPTLQTCSTAPRLSFLVILKPSCLFRRKRSLPLSLAIVSHKSFTLHSFHDSNATHGFPCFTRDSFPVHSLATTRIVLTGWLRTLMIYSYTACKF